MPLRRAPGLAHWKKRHAESSGLVYKAGFLSPADSEAIQSWLQTLRPLWEHRYSEVRPLAPGQQQRRLLRPVYWLGNWQFACLDYYRPPDGIRDRCVVAEPFPPLLRRITQRIEAIAREEFTGQDLPKGWELNTCLVNLYGRRLEGDRWLDSARVGEHKDFEPGPVASLSLGERALFQFVSSRRPGERDGVVSQQWLADRSLQIFGGERWKKRMFHRVQRVDQQLETCFALAVDDFETRRVNFTFRFVPRQHWVRYADLAPQAQADVRGYVETLARSSEFFAAELAEADRSRKAGKPR